MDTHIQSAYRMLFEGLTILECGSHEDGGETKDFRQRNTCYYIDAEKSAVNKLKEKPGINSENVFCFALSDTDGEADFTETSHPGNSSIRHLPEHIDDLIQYTGCSFKTVRVQTKSYKSFLEMIGKPIDILILDIEGAEPLVLLGMKELPIEKLPKIICIEAGFDWPVRKSLLLELGYIIDYYDYNNVVLHHSSFNVTLNEEYVRSMNQTNPRFTWHGKEIYTNHLI